jgi:hypothetical protein
MGAEAAPIDEELAGVFQVFAIIGLETLHHLRQEPDSALGLINPNFDQTGGRQILVFIGKLMGGAEIACERLIIGVELCQDFLRGNVFVVVVRQALVAGDIVSRP